MCGLCGVMWKNEDTASEQKRRISYSYLKSMETRGKDSFGVTNGREIFKDVDTIDTVVGELYYNNPDRLEKLDRIMESDLFLGHTRMATVGKVTAKNAHPFQSGPFIVAHNGSVSGYNYKESKMKKNLDDYNDNIETDSYRIAGLIHKYYKTNESVENRVDKTVEAIKSMSNDLSGSMTIWVYNTDIDKLFVARRSNPLKYVEFEDALIFASELDLNTESESVPNNTVGLMEKDGYKQMDEIEGSLYSLNSFGGYGGNYSTNYYTGGGRSTRYNSSSNANDTDFAYISGALLENRIDKDGYSITKEEFNKCT